MKIRALNSKDAILIITRASVIGYGRNIYILSLLVLINDTYNTTILFGVVVKPVIFIAI